MNAIEQKLFHLVKINQAIATAEYRMKMAQRNAVDFIEFTDLCKHYQQRARANFHIMKKLERYFEDQYRNLSMIITVQNQVL